MSEDVFIIESLLKHPCWISEKTIQAIENLINKNNSYENLKSKLKNVLDKYEHVEANEESAIEIYTELKNIYESGNEQ